MLCLSIDRLRHATVLPPDGVMNVDLAFDIVQVPNSQWAAPQTALKEKNEL